MKLLHFADLHLDTSFHWAPPEVARARRQALRETLLRICKRADEQRVDALTCGGGLYEQERFTPDTADFLRCTFAKLAPLPVFLSEQGNLRFQESGKVPHAPFRAEQVEQAKLHHALLGHFHHPKDAPQYTYPGNPDPLTFGETDGRAAVLVTVAADGTVSRKRFPVASSMVSDVRVDLTGVTHSGQVAERVRAKLSGPSGVARVTLDGEVGRDVDLCLRDITTLAARAGLAAVVPRLGKISVAYDFEQLAQERTVRGQFVRDVRGIVRPPAREGSAVGGRAAIRRITQAVGPRRGAGQRPDIAG